MGESLTITIFSMVVVFIVLIAISYLIEILRITTNGKKGKEEPKKAIVEEKAVEKKEQIVSEEKVNDEELVAVIAAAVAASLGTTIPQIKIKTIKRISPTTPLWSEAGRREQILERL
ncbi:OadG family protein [Schnuerera ultunensis]|uniref:Oxaloacetate decarboxylase gamma chain n=1 Tax=[Clostridium] ultunense Esp TaxID=1288971 RepID=A0A1M4PSH6_9FIRM|nr:OadG family protein [Schnuerera ultunensis]SHD78467.1 Oxaloacetate decarboxylase gamma chain [[Clostridium] ultunense Esp]